MFFFQRSYPLLALLLILLLFLFVCRGTWIQRWWRSAVHASRGPERREAAAERGGPGWACLARQVLTTSCLNSEQKLWPSSYWTHMFQHYLSVIIVPSLILSILAMYMAKFRHHTWWQGFLQFLLGAFVENWTR
jgi:hypothetical protein